MSVSTISSKIPHTKANIDCNPGGKRNVALWTAYRVTCSIPLYTATTGIIGEWRLVALRMQERYDAAGCMLHQQVEQTITIQA